MSKTLLMAIKAGGPRRYYWALKGSKGVPKMFKKLGTRVIDMYHRLLKWRCGFSNECLKKIIKFL